MTFTKNKLAAAMAGAFIAGAGSQAAFAVVDLDSTANAGVSIASETIIGTAGVNLTDAGAAGTFDVNATMNANAIPDNTDIRVSITLSSGTWTAAPSLALDNTANACNASGTTPTFAIFTGGGTADSTVTFNSNAGGQDVVAGCEFVLTTNGITVLDQSAVNITYDVDIADNFGPTNLGGATGAFASFAPLVSLSADATGAETTKNIDVAADSLLFTGSSTSINVGGWQIDESTAGRVDVTGAALDNTDIVGTAQGTITAANGFGAFDQGTAVSGGAITCGGVAGSFSTADATLAACAAYNPAAGGDATAANAVVLTVDGGTANTVQIAETTLTATVAATSAATATYSAANATGTVNLLSLSRNGSSASLSFALTPEGAYPMFIRVVNPSAVAGPVTLTLTNDDGETSDAFNISTITGGPAGDLAAGASTDLLSIDDVFAAAQAADADFALGASSNKLRVNAVAEFGAAGATSVKMNAFSVSTDGTSFFMLTDASN